MKQLFKCLNCGTEFIKSRKDKMCCSKYCSVRFYYKINKKEILDKVNNDAISRFIKENKSNKEIVEDLLQDFKRKSWYVDSTDIFRLIDVYDRVFPEKFLPNKEPQLIFIKMVAELHDWLKKIHTV
jgi:DNA-directed RNA polymerase subunit RPC12/RpoP